MAHIQSVSSKLKPINKANNEINVMASYNKKEYYPRPASGKENVGDSKKLESINVFFGNYHFLSPEKFRARKSSDSVIYNSHQKNTFSDSNKIKGLINHWESKKNAQLKRHLSEDVASSSGSHMIIDGDPFPKPDFKIYISQDRKKREEGCLKGRSDLPHVEKAFSRKRSIASISTLNKENELMQPHQTQSKFKKLKVQNPVQSVLLIDNIETPADTLPLPGNLNKIKDYHKKSSLEGRYQHLPSDSLPADLLYNLEYMEDFISLQLELEGSHQLSPQFLEKGINREQRKMVTSFLIRVTAYCKYPSYILYQTIKIFDAMLDSKWIEINQLQLVGLTSLWIILKRWHTISNVLTAGEILSFSKGEYKEKDLFKCEIDIMKTLNCQISYIDPFSILAYYFLNINNPFIHVNRTDIIYYCASYMIDVSLLSSTFCKVSTFDLITAAAEIALFIVLAKEDDLQNPDWQFWRSCLPKIYRDERKMAVVELELQRTRKNLIKLALMSNGASKEYLAVYKKYKRSRYGCISEIVIGKLSKIPQDELNS